jgi:SAM-dependent methyltransferase
MHESSMKNMQTCYDKYIVGDFSDSKQIVSVLDIGSICKNISGSYRQVFKDDKIKYIGVDLKRGKYVDVVLEDPYKYPFESESMDVVISGQTFEHCEFFWEAFVEMSRVLKKDGYLFLIAPSSGNIHRYPVDCYRFYPDSYKAIAKYAKINLVESWLDNTSKWRDLVGVFNKSC